MSLRTFIEDRNGTKASLKPLVVGIVALVLIIITFNSFFMIQNKKEIAIKTKWGVVAGETLTKSGLRFKIPFYTGYIVTDGRIQQVDAPPQTMTTGDKRGVELDYVGRYRVVDLRKYYTKTSNSSERAKMLINNTLIASLKEQVQESKLVETLRPSNRSMQTLNGESITADKIELGRDSLLAVALANSKISISEYGLELIDLKIKHFAYNKKNHDALYKRMSADLDAIASHNISEGDGQKEIILGQLAQDRKTIESEAKRKADETRGRGLAMAASIYNKSYRGYGEFYKFVRELQAWENSVDENTVIFETPSGLMDMANRHKK